MRIVISVRDDLELRQRQPEDAEELFALTDRNRAYLRQWLPWLDHCTSPADTRKNIETSLRDAEAGTGLAVSIWQQNHIVGVTRIQLDVRADNERAIRLCERVGFVREGLKKNAMRINGEYFDEITMALLLT